MQIFKDEKQQTEFMDWIITEINQAESERSQQKETWKKWRRQREARPERAQKDYPWPKASNLCVPVANIVATTMYGHLKKTFAVKEPFFTAVALNKENREDVAMCEIVAKYVNILAESPFELAIKKKNRDLLYEAGSMGTCFAKVIWSVVPWTFKQIDAEGNAETVEGRLHDGVDIVPIPMDDIIYRQAIQDLQRATWIAHQYLVTDIELEDMLAMTDMDDVSAVLDYEVQMTPEWKQDSQNRMGIMELPDKVKKLHEVYWRQDIDGDGKSEECMATIHAPTRTCLQSAYNEIGMRPIVAMNYMHRPFFINGIGTGWLAEAGQDEIDTIHNQRIDSMHVAILPMFSARKASGVKPNEKLYPGKIFILNQVGDIVPLRSGENPTSSVQAEGMSREYVQRATGMSDIMSGFADQTMRTADTMGGQNQRLQQGTMMTTSIIEAAEDAYSQLAAMVFFQLVQHRDEVIKKELLVGRLSPKDIEVLNKALSIPMKDIPGRLRFSVRTTNVDQTIQQKQQNLLFQVQLQQMFYDKAFPMLMQVFNPQVPEPIKAFAGKVFTSSMRTLEKILKFYEEFETEKYVPDYKQFEFFNDIKQTMLGFQYEQQAKQMMEAMNGGSMAGRIAPAGPGSSPQMGGSGGGVPGAAIPAQGPGGAGQGGPGAQQGGGMAAGGAGGNQPNPPGMGG